MTQEISPTRKATLGATALVIAAMLALPSGMAPVFADFPWAPDASKIYDPQGDSPLVDFDIKQAFIDSDGSLNLMVYGTAGNTLPAAMHDAYAYVVVTDDGIYVADSHEAQHADDEQVANKAWHGHKVVVSETGCVTEIGSFMSHAKLAGSNVKITDAHATKILAALTVQLEILVEDPDNPGDAPCIAQLVQVFDSAA